MFSSICLLVPVNYCHYCCALDVVERKLSAMQLTVYNASVLVLFLSHHLIEVFLEEF